MLASTRVCTIPTIRQPHLDFAFLVHDRISNLSFPALSIMHIRYEACIAFALLPPIHMPVSSRLCVIAALAETQT